ncbi:hypothetical protein HYPBUDRAFT_148670 [Hyphopichia burtonii NRRL Y-1933]|uniref:CBS domain-containing protein n=1 Tax=Hyphopichia burtonii NRRL Y-1933 TaxID=984485 RepID=A0A1E4RI37_9ASCO|nr:hypothetical protein HYPBUDRAFT_148670 [Hyphopichia burtonii NRRL Y-1933]ODV66891.1 hypothetical protein HYPBUDRAFT_148670 [Hyphopichia burtonii NRRL Y-1933]
MSDNVVLFHTRDYRGATVEDLDIAPAVSINPSTSLDQALEISFENEFTFLPVIHESNKRLLGILNIESLKKDPSKYKRSFLKPVAVNYMLWFHQKSRENYEREQQEVNNQGTTKTSLNTTMLKPKSPKGKKYSVITPMTPLEELARFFNQGNYFAIITNDKGNFVYGVATPEDLIRYEKSRPRL